VPDLRALPRVALSPVASPASRGGARALELLGVGVMRGLSLLRGERAVHARGTTLHARLLVPGGAGLGVPLFDEPGAHTAVARFSRAVGVPDALPDVLGVGVRVLDAHGPGRHQDLLLDSTSELPLARRLPLPMYDLLGAPYGSLTPYELAGRRHLLWLLPDDSAPPTRSLSQLAGRGDGTRLRLAVSSAHGAPRQVAALELGGTSPGGREIRFSPDVTGGGIAPAGWLQDFRRSAYRASHVGPDA
jgi:hypothetical protein